MGEPAKTLRVVLLEHHEYVLSGGRRTHELEAWLLAWARARELRYGERVLTKVKDRLRTLGVMGEDVITKKLLPEPETEAT